MTDPSEPHLPAAPPKPAPVRLNRRPLPTAGGTFAGAGIALAVIGVIIWAGSYAVSGISVGFESGNGGSGRNWLGVVLALVVTVVGYVLAIKSPDGVLATAGVAASAAGVPTAIGFITLDVTGGLPINIDALFIATIAVWLLSYAVVPGTRGHSFYLGLSAVALWVYIVIKISPDVFGLPFLSFARTIAGSSFDQPDLDLGTLAAISFILGAAYYGIGFLFDREGHQGVATPLMVAGFPVTVGAFGFAADDFGQVGTGIALVIVSAILVYVGSRAHRRFTTWAWGFGLVEGVALLVTKVSPDNKTAVGILFILVGLAVAALGVSTAYGLREREYPEN